MQVWCKVAASLAAAAAVGGATEPVAPDFGPRLERFTYPWPVEVMKSTATGQPAQVVVHRCQLMRGRQQVEVRAGLLGDDPQSLDLAAGECPRAARLDDAQDAVAPAVGGDDRGRGKGADRRLNAGLPALGL